MKKSCVALALILCLCLSGCEEVEQTEQESKSKFVCIETTAIWKVVYDRDTKVMYTVSNYGQGSGCFALLVNADGTPMLYDGE